MLTRSLSCQVAFYESGSSDRIGSEGRASGNRSSVPRGRQYQPSGLWAYAYLITAPRSRSGLSTIRTIVEQANVAARGDARIWSGRLVRERRITHLLIVSDCSEQDLEVNQRLETELNGLKAVFVLTESMAVEGSASPPPSE